MPRIQSTPSRPLTNKAPIDFTNIPHIARANAHSLVSYLLPAGRLEGHEWTALNPTRSDRRIGSFRINLNTGKWADFATGDKGGDLISLAAYVRSSSQGDAARWIKDHLTGGVL